jgi:hypothetical protein
MGNAHDHGDWAVTCIENMDRDYHFAEEEEESANVQIIWEFQRYQKGVGWGAGDNFNSNDPGRFSSYDRKIFGNTLQVFLFYFLRLTLRRVSIQEFRSAGKLILGGQWPSTRKCPSTSKG